MKNVSILFVITARLNTGPLVLYIREILFRPMKKIVIHKKDI